MELVMQYKVMETYLRFRSIPEEIDEMLRPKMVEISAQHLSQEADTLEASLQS